jgi:AraC-like DNA-binding protein
MRECILCFRDKRLMIRDMAVPDGSDEPRRRRRASDAGGSWRVHVAPLRAIPLVLARFNVASGPILGNVGLTPADFDDPSRTITYAEGDRLFAACVRRTRCAHFGLLVGEHVTLRSFGLIGRLARNAPTVGRALEELRSSFILHENGGSTNFTIADGRVTLAYSIHGPGMRHADQVYDMAVAATVNVMRQLCGPEWRPSELLLPRARPADQAPYRRCLAATLRFNAATAGAVFPEHWLGRPVWDADPVLYDLIRDRIQGELAHLDPRLEVEVRKTVRRLLASGQCSRAAVARSIGMHERTLGRRLLECGTTFRTLLDDTRLQVSKQLLRDTRLSVASVAANVGIRDSTVFTRAFRRWTGKTPREFRIALGRNDGRLARGS